MLMSGLHTQKANFSRIKFTLFNMQFNAARSSKKSNQASYSPGRTSGLSVRFLSRAFGLELLCSVFHKNRTNTMLIIVMSLSKQKASEDRNSRVAATHDFQHSYPSRVSQRDESGLLYNSITEFEHSSLSCKEKRPW